MYIGGMVGHPTSVTFSSAHGRLVPGQTQPDAHKRWPIDTTDKHWTRLERFLDRGGKTVMSRVRMEGERGGHRCLAAYVSYGLVAHRGQVSTQTNAHQRHTVNCHQGLGDMVTLALQDTLCIEHAYSRSLHPLTRYTCVCIVYTCTHHSTVVKHGPILSVVSRSRSNTNVRARTNLHDDATFPVPHAPSA